MPHILFNRQLLTLAVFGAVMLLGLAGCSTPIQRDVYEQKMSGEIRVLEDQLYDADYQNRVLRDRLEQCRKEKACDPEDIEMGSSPIPPSSSGPAFMSDGPIPVPDSVDGFVDPGSFDSGTIDYSNEAPFQDFVPQDFVPPPPTSQVLETDEWGVIEIDPGQPIGGASASNEGSSQTGSPSAKEASTRTPATAGSSNSRDAIVLPTPPPELDPEAGKITLPQALTDPPSTDSSSGPPPSPIAPPGNDPGNKTSPLPRAPTEPQPPGKRDLRAPALIPGEIGPPTGDPGAEPLPPGKIELPEGINDDVPVEIQIHPQFTGGSSNESGDVDQIMVVVHATDASGKTVPLENFDIQADLSVVVMDPELPVGNDKIGRWDFTPTQTSTMIRTLPVSGLHIPIRWGDARPTGSEIVVHARLRSEGESLKCQARIPLQKPVEVSAVWTPRAK